MLEIGASRIPEECLLTLPELAGTSRVGVDLDGPYRVADVEVSRADATALPFENDSFDLVLCNSVLEHEPRFWMVLSEIRRVLRPGAQLVIGVPAFSPLPKHRLGGGITATLHYHGFPKDYYRFSPTAVEEILLEGLDQKTILEVMSPPRVIGYGFKPLAHPMQGLRVLVTGAGGSIGSLLCEAILKQNPSQLVRLDKSPLDQRPPIDNRLRDVTLDVRDESQLHKLIRETEPHVVIHAAANKHVPALEGNPWEAIDNNVLGTRNVVRLSRAFGVRRLLLVSTDKAVDAVNVMGQSKRVAELYTLASGFSCVRLVNVYGSSGSVVEIFKAQIEKNEPLTVTSSEMTRFFMQPEDACRLILAASELAEGGDILVLDGGPPVKITDIARDLLRAAGKTLDVVLTGVRPGERIHEMPMLPDPLAERTQVDSVWRLRPMNSGNPEELIRPLLEVHQDSSSSQLREALRVVSAL